MIWSTLSDPCDFSLYWDKHLICEGSYPTRIITLGFASNTLISCSYIGCLIVNSVQKILTVYMIENLFSQRKDKTWIEEGKSPECDCKLGVWCTVDAATCPSMAPWFLFVSDFDEMGFWFDSDIKCKMAVKTVIFLVGLIQAEASIWSVQFQHFLCRRSKYCTLTQQY